MATTNVDRGIATINIDVAIASINVDRHIAIDNAKAIETIATVYVCIDSYHVLIHIIDSYHDTSIHSIDSYHDIDSYAYASTCIDTYKLSTHMYPSIACV